MNLLGIVSTALVTWLVAVFAFPFQYWLNSWIRRIWLFTTGRPKGIAGHWIATFDYESRNPPKKQTEDVIAQHLFRGELRGSIYNRISTQSFIFQGRMLMDEAVGHYWRDDMSRDIGTFQLKLKEDQAILEGDLTFYDTEKNKTIRGVNYKWHYLPPRIIRCFTKVHQAKSELEGAGLFAHHEFSAGDKIGSLTLGKDSSQGKHTIEFKGKHRIVRKPWRFLNHACKPNSELSSSDKKITLKAIVDVLPQTEVTIDYRKFEEQIGTPFDCNCPTCKDSAKKVRIT